MDGVSRGQFESFLADALSADRVETHGWKRLSGGAIQENWAFDAHVEGGARAGKNAFVLRTDSPTGVAVSHDRVTEFELLKAAYGEGVKVPEPIAASRDKAILGKEFCIMARAEGIALGPKIVKDIEIGGDRETLVETLGRELAKIHRITPETHRFDALPPPPDDPQQAELHAMIRHYDALGHARPVLDWAIHWLHRHKQSGGEIVLAHHDFRTGNYMVDDTGLTAILDWEFAGWSDPHEDIGWFTAMCWRFSRRDLTAGGIGSRNAFYRGYENASGRRIDPARVYWWEVYAHLRWAVIALQQGDRYLTGGERTLDLGLTGLRPAEMELELLRLTDPARRTPESAERQEEEGE